MQRFIFLFAVLLSFLSGFAKTPAVPLCQAFDGRYNNVEGVKIYEVRQENNYYYSIDVKNNPEIVEQLQSWAKESEQSANSVSTSISNGRYNVILYIPDLQLNVGINYPSDNSSIKVFLQSSSPFM